MQMEMEAEEILRRYAAGERNFAGVVFNRFTNLAGARLTEIDLSRAILPYQMQGIDLYRANLSNAGLIDTDLSGANLREANLEGAALENTKLCGADLTKCNMRKVCGRTLYWGAQMRWVDLTDAELIQSSFEGADLGEAILTDANFEETNLRRVNLLGCVGATINSARMGATILPDGSIGHEARYTYP
jgi:uncharacterized protein YjbI with pentapeptide repeats